jgi:N-acetylglutamate synthase-like GNAT family acetyltransferase
MLADLEISTDPGRLDVGLIHETLARSYWAQNRSRTVVERSIQNSLCVGAYLSNQQVAFARVISDRAVFGYLADVFVVPQFRGHGIAKRLMQDILEHADLRGLQLILLRTRDAHALYAQFGFEEVPRPDELMARYASVQG